MSRMNSPDVGSVAPLNPTQRAVFDRLLSVGGERPYARPGLADALRARLEAGTSEPLGHWTEPSLWLSKGALFAVRNCEGNFVASRLTQDEHISPTEAPPIGVVNGIVTHRAIQLAHTHPGYPVADLVAAAVAGCIDSDEKVAAFWFNSGAAAQSDLLVSATSRTMGLLDSWPALHPTWAPRFEEALQVKVGRLTLSGRVDLLLGRPRPDGKQTMLICDWKSGGLKDDHLIEADLYALLATLRFGVPPYRSTVYSLASGDWTDPDVTEERLVAACDWVIESVRAIVDTLTEQRPPTLTPSGACLWCPASATCPAFPRKDTAAASPVGPGADGSKRDGLPTRDPVVVPLGDGIPAVRADLGSAPLSHAVIASLPPTSQLPTAITQAPTESALAASSASVSETAPSEVPDDYPPEPDEDPYLTSTEAGNDQRVVPEVQRPEARRAQAAGLVEEENLWFIEVPHKAG